MTTITSQVEASQVTLQEELNDLVRDLGLPKDGAVLLTPFMKKKNILAKDVKVDYFRNRGERFRKYSTKIDDLSLLYSNSVQGFMDELKAGFYKD